MPNRTVGWATALVPAWAWDPVTARWPGSILRQWLTARLSDLKAQLKITTAQEAAWQTFAAQAKAQAASMQAMRAQMQAGHGNGSGTNGQRATAMQQRAAGMATMTNAFGALYAVLTPEQKAIADQNVGMMGHRGMGFGRRAG